MTVLFSAQVMFIINLILHIKILNLSFKKKVNNPADLNEVIAVGGLDVDNNTVAVYSSRGMTTQELSYGIGRAKPDVLTCSRYIFASDLDNKCQMKSGTSVATPIITASLSIVISIIKNSTI